MTQLVARIDDDLVAAVDRLVEARVVGSRSDAVRVGLRELVDRNSRARVAAEIVAGYEQTPQDEDEIGAVDARTRAMIAAEPW